MKASAFFTKDGKLILIDLDEVRLLVGNAVLFKNDPKMYDIGDEAAEALRKAFSARSPA